MSENAGGFFFPFPFIPDAETLERMRQAQDHRDMVVDDYHHSVARLFSVMDEEQLTAQKRLLHVIATNSKGSSRVIPAFYEGIIVGLLSERYGICIGCDNNHDKLMAEQMEREKDVKNDTLVTPEKDSPFQPGKPSEDIPIGSTGMLSDKQIKDMAEYGLDDVRDQDTNELLGFICENCRTRYVSIEDRMLKPSDKSGCSGCVQKEQWG